jgi:hypothetical protein
MIPLATIALIPVLVAILLAGLCFWVLRYFGAPQPLCLIAAVLVFLLCLAGGVSIH